MSQKWIFLWMMYTLSLDMFNGVYKNNKGAAEFFLSHLFFLKKKTCRYGCSSEIKLIKSKECLGGGGKSAIGLLKI